MIISWIFTIARACLLGGALGYPIEFSHGPFLDVTFEGIVSDDAQMTLFTAEGIVDGDVHEAYQRWLRTQLGERDDNVYGLMTIPQLWVRRAPGNTCLSALVQNAQFDRLPTVESPPNDSKGCGAVMRSAPFGIAARSREEAFAKARDAGVLTHGHPSGYLSAAIFASIVFDLLRDASYDDAIDRGIALLQKERGHEETLRAIEKARALGDGNVETLGGGWVGEEALAIAIACAGHDDVRSTLWRAVAHAGDSDSTGSLAGNLLGARLGMAALPADWLERLELRETIVQAADALSG